MSSPPATSLVAAHGTPRAHHRVHSSSRPRSAPDHVPRHTTLPCPRSARSATSGRTVQRSCPDVRENTA